MQNSNSSLTPVKRKQPDNREDSANQRKKSQMMMNDTDGSNDVLSNEPINCNLLDDDSDKDAI